MPTKDLIELTSGFLCTYLIKFTPHCKKLTTIGGGAQDQSNSGNICIQLKQNWVNACNLRFASNTGLSHNVNKVAIVIFVK